MKNTLPKLKNEGGSFWEEEKPDKMPNYIRIGNIEEMRYKLKDKWALLQSLKKKGMKNLELYNVGISHEVKNV